MWRGWSGWPDGPWDPEAGMKLLLIRHGQTPSNVRGLLDTGAPGAELTKLGHEQARALPKALDGEPIDSIAQALRTDRADVARRAQRIVGRLRPRLGERGDERALGAGQPKTA